MWGDPVLHCRHFTIADGLFVIEDRLEGKRRHRIETLFQWSSDLVLARESEATLSFHSKDVGKRVHGTLRLVCGNRPANDESSPQIMLCSGQVAPYRAGWFFPGYGQEVRSTTSIFEVTGQLPMAQRYILQMEAIG